MKPCFIFDGIDDKDYSVVEHDFLEYAESYIGDDEVVNNGVRLKLEHSLRVRSNSEVIAQSIGITGKDLNTIKAASILHDIGRFQQFSKYKTFADSKSVNHATLGSEIISKTEILGHISKKTAAIIKTAVGVHNVLTVGNGDTDLITVLHIVRDSDKLDILKVITDFYNQASAYNPMKIDLPDTGKISPAVSKSIMSGELVNMADLSSIDDFKLLVAAWIFDINFNKTREILIEKDYIKTILETLPDSREASVIKGVIKKELYQQKRRAA